MTRHTMSERSYHGATSRSTTGIMSQYRHQFVFINVVFLKSALNVWLQKAQWLTDID